MIPQMQVYEVAICIDGNVVILYLDFAAGALV